MRLVKLFPKNVHVIRWMHAGPLGPHMDSYAAEIHQQGYAATTVQAHLGLLTDFSRWLRKAFFRLWKRERCSAPYGQS